MAACKLFTDKNYYTPTGDTGISIQRAVNPEVGGFDLLIQRENSTSYRKFFQRIANVQQALSFIKHRLEDPNSLPVNSLFSFKVLTLDNIAINKDHIRIGVQSFSSGLFGTSKQMREFINNQILKQPEIFSGVLRDIQLTQEEFDSIFDWKKEGKATVIYVNFFLTDAIVKRIFSPEKDEIAPNNDINRMSMSSRQSFVKSNYFAESIIVEKEAECEDLDIEEEKDSAISIKINELRFSNYRINSNDLTCKNETNSKESHPRLGRNQTLPLDRGDDTSMAQSTASFVSMAKSSIVSRANSMIVKNDPMSVSFSPVLQASKRNDHNQNRTSIMDRFHDNESIFSDTESIIIEKPIDPILKNATEDLINRASRVEIVANSKSDLNPMRTTLTSKMNVQEEEPNRNNDEKEMVKSSKLDLMNFSMVESIVVSKSNRTNELPAEDVNEIDQSREIGRNSEVKKINEVNRSSVIHRSSEVNQPNEANRTSVVHQANEDNRSSEVKRSSTRLADHPLIKGFITPGYE